MNYYSFEYPYLILLLPPILYCLYRCKEFAQSKYFVHLHLLSAKKNFLKLEWIVKILLVISLVIALCSPIVIDKHDPLNRKGKDIVLAIDASGSMNSSGYAQSNDFLDLDESIASERLSRFEITKHIVGDFILRRDGDNIGVVLFGDFAFIASPITYEKDILKEMISYLNQGMAGQNTAIGEALAMGVRAFKHSRAKTKIIILLTDGEHNSGAISPKEAMELVENEGIKVYTIAVGNKEEADSALLQKIAQKSGGEFFGASNAKELAEVYETIDTLESSKIKSREYAQKEYYYHYFLLLACAFLLLLLFRGMRR
ncbi:MAG: VWA domain-containing protein [Sulfurimonas sp.]|jgi:Ca-activated chloride channel family protein|nr:VWA domain-containing protein [Sulfurimonas sp.]